MNPKNSNKSPIHENADANITCDFGDGDISRSRSFLSNTYRRERRPDDPEDGQSRGLLKFNSRYKNKLIAILRKEKKKYYCLLLQENKNNIAGTWMILRTIMGNAHKTHDFPAKLNNNGNMTNDQTNIANMFNGFFTNVGPDLAKNITAPGDSSIFDYMQNRNENCMFLTPVDEVEVSRVVASCKNKLSTDANELSMYIIKRIIATIVTPITHICNLSFKNGVFPDKMKTAKIIPIFKSGDREDCTNYRPISLLPQISKILEKLFNRRLSEFLEKYKVISPTQYGFRENMSTCFALTELVDEITASLD